MAILFASSLANTTAGLYLLGNLLPPISFPQSLHFVQTTSPTAINTLPAQTSNVDSHFDRSYDHP